MPACSFNDDKNSHRTTLPDNQQTGEFLIQRRKLRKLLLSGCVLLSIQAIQNKHFTHIKFSRLCR